MQQEMGKKLKTKEERQQIVEDIKAGALEVPQPDELWKSGMKFLKPLLNQAVMLGDQALVTIGDQINYIKYQKKGANGNAGQWTEFFVLFDDARVPTEKFRTPEFDINGEKYQWRILGQIRLNAKLVKAGEVIGDGSTQRGVSFSMDEME